MSGGWRREWQVEKGVAGGQVSDRWRGDWQLWQIGNYFKGALEDSSLKKQYLITDLKEEEKQADIMAWSFVVKIGNQNTFSYASMTQRNQ